MTTPATPEAVEAAMQYDKEPREMTGRQDAILEAGPFVREGDNAVRILAAEVERLRCELGHAQDKLERIRTLCLGSGVGLRDDVLDVVGRGEVSRGMPYPGSAQDMMEDMAALAGAVVTARPK